MAVSEADGPIVEGLPGGEEGDCSAVVMAVGGGGGGGGRGWARAKGLRRARGSWGRAGRPRYRLPLCTRVTRWRTAASCSRCLLLSSWWMRELPEPSRLR